MRKLKLQTIARQIALAVTVGCSLAPAQAQIMDNVISIKNCSSKEIEVYMYNAWDSNLENRTQPWFINAGSTVEVSCSSTPSTGGPSYNSCWVEIECPTCITIANDLEVGAYDYQIVEGNPVIGTGSCSAQSSIPYVK